MLGRGNGAKSDCLSRSEMSAKRCIPEQQLTSEVRKSCPFLNVIGSSENRTRKMMKAEQIKEMIESASDVVRLNMTAREINVVNREEVVEKRREASATARRSCSWLSSMTEHNPRAQDTAVNKIEQGPRWLGDRCRSSSASSVLPPRDQTEFRRVR